MFTELEEAGDGEAQGAGEGAPVGDVGVHQAAGGGAGEGGERGDHEQDGAELVDDDDPPAEVVRAGAGPAVARLDEAQVAGDQEEDAADHVGRPDQPVDLLDVQAVQEGVQQVDGEDEVPREANVLSQSTRIGS
jgi:hypothetical protein